MWIDRKEYEVVRMRAAQDNAICLQQAQQIATLTASLQWLQVRVTQLEKERAQLIGHYMGIKVEVPEITVERRDQRGAEALSDAAASFFQDMGDQEAAKQGVSWDENGNLVYAKQS